MLGTVALVVLGALLVVILALWIVGERGRLMRASTWRLIREGGRLHGYVYGRWTRQYISLLLNHLPPKPGVGKWFANHYHGKVLTHEHAEAILLSKKDIPLQDLEQIIPYPTARNLVLKGPPEVAAYECVCRHARKERCQPTQVCMVVGQPFVDFIVDHHPQTSRRLTQAEALELLEAEHQRGHVHSAWFKDAMLNRFYAICNCCKCCCGGIQSMTQLGMPLMLSSGYVAEINQELCNRCLVCAEACPFNALSMNGGGLERNWEKCMGCGVCEHECPTQAIALVRDEQKGIPLDVRLLA